MNTALAWCVFGLPDGSYARQEHDSYVDFVKNTSASGQFAQQWKLKEKAREATLEKTANNKLRRGVAPRKTFQRAEIAPGGSVICYERIGRGIAPEWRGPAD